MMNSPVDPLADPVLETSRLASWTPVLFELGIVLSWLLLVSGFEVTGAIAAFSLLAAQIWDRGGRGKRSIS